MMIQILDGLQEDKESYRGRSISEIMYEMKEEAISGAVDCFSEKWRVDHTAVLYAAENHNHGEIPNTSILIEHFHYNEYKENT